MSTQTKRAGGQAKLQRLQLVARVRLAYDSLKDTMQRYHDDSSLSRVAVAAAKARLAVLNRALAVLALESAGAGQLA